MATNQSSNPQVVSTKEKTQRIIEQRAALADLWLALAISEAPPSNLQWAVWLTAHDYPALESALTITAQWLLRQEDPTSITQERKIKYVSGVLHGTKFDSLTPEEREAKISEQRSKAGKLGALKKWQNTKREVCHQLPALCQVCHQLPLFCQCSSCSHGSSGSSSVSRGFSDSQSQSQSSSLESKPKPPNFETPETPVENLEPKTTEPKTENPTGGCAAVVSKGVDTPPTAGKKEKNTKPRLCPKCGGLLNPKVNHLLTCPAENPVAAKPKERGLYKVNWFEGLDDLDGNPLDANGDPIKLDKAWLGDVYQGPDVSPQKPNAKLASFLDGD